MRRAAPAVLLAVILTAASAARADAPADAPILVVRGAVGENELSLGFRGALQMRALFPFESGHARARGDLAEGTSLQLHRVRLALDATILPTVRAHVTADALGAEPIFLAYGDVDLRVTQLRAGLVRVPFTRRGLVDETRQVFLEPPSAWRADRAGFGPAPAVLPDRRVGAELHEEVDGYAASIGVFSADRSAASSSALFAGRLELAPWGGVPLEGAYFRDDAGWGAPRLTLAIGALARMGDAGTARAASVAIGASYRGLASSVEAVIGTSRLAADTPDVAQRALALDLAYRFPIGSRTELEIGGRADVLQTDPTFDAAGDLRALSAVANLYFWRHRVKASTLARVVRARDASFGARGARPGAHEEGILELTVGF